MPCQVHVLPGPGSRLERLATESKGLRPQMATSCSLGVSSRLPFSQCPRLFTCHIDGHWKHCIIGMLNMFSWKPILRSTPFTAELRWIISMNIQHHRWHYSHCSHACPSPWCTPLLLASTARRNHRCSAASQRESQHRRRRWRHRRGGQRWCPQGLRHHSCHAGRHRRQLGHLGDQPWWCGRQVKRAIRQGTRCEASGQLRSEPLRAKARQWAHWAFQILAWPGEDVMEHHGIMEYDVIYCNIM